MHHGFRDGVPVMFDFVADCLAQLLWRFVVRYPARAAIFNLNGLQEAAIVSLEGYGCCLQHHHVGVNRPVAEK